MLAALAVCASAATSHAQPMSCSSAPASVCESPDLLALEAERAALIDQIAKRDPQSSALASEQTWIDGLSACGDDAGCYRTAYLNHNQTLRQAVADLPGATTGPTLSETPAETPTVEEQTQALDQVQAERLREPRPDPGRAYGESSAPGWGFYTAIGITLLIFWWLMRALGRHRRDMAAERQRFR